MLHADWRIAGKETKDLGPGRRSRVRSVSLFQQTDGVLMEERWGASDAAGQMMSELLSEHQNVLDCVKGLQEHKIRRARASELERDF